MTNFEISKTCVSDRPIEADSDVLGNSKYALGLLKFIESADTPVTIGIQGGWGSGKTSLINILQHHLEKNGETLSIFVNAWEHSLFHNENDKSSVAISLLTGVVELICQVIEAKTEKSSSDSTPRISKDIMLQALCEDSSLRKFGKMAVGLVALSARIGAKLVADVDVPTDTSDSQEKVSGARIIRDLRSDMAHAVGIVTANSPYKRFVCFIDDLDRVHPRTAIEILDVLKNVFDVPECIFVLAIDYDVVVKGLSEKYGEKNTENEREFRQYFDKIIQVPFSMPVGTYAEKMESLISEHLSSINLFDGDARRIAEVAYLSTDGVPRGVKRIINTLSLLAKIRESSDEEEAHTVTSVQLEILFIVVALQINFPEIYRKLADSPKFTNWDKDTIGKWGLLENEELQKCLLEDGTYNESFFPFHNEHLFDEEWEKVLFLVCLGDDWLRNKADNISRILNTIRDIQNECEGGLGDAYLKNALDAANVTEIGGEVKQKTDHILLGEISALLENPLRSSSRVAGPTFFSDNKQLTYYVNARKSGKHHLSIGRSKDVYDDIKEFLEANGFIVDQGKKGGAKIMNIDPQKIASAINLIEKEFVPTSN